MLKMPILLHFSRGDNTLFMANSPFSIQKINNLPMLFFSKKKRKKLEFSVNINYKAISLLLQIYDIAREQISCNYGIAGNE